MLVSSCWRLGRSHVFVPCTAVFFPPNLIWRLAKNNAVGILFGVQEAAPTVYVEFQNVYLCLYNQLFALFHYVFKFLTP